MSVTESFGSLVRAAAGLYTGATQAVAEPILELEHEIEERLRRIPTHMNAYGYDAFGFNRESARRSLVMTALFYRYWFRVDTHDIARVPEGRVLLIANHAGQVAIDAAMIGVAMVLEAEPPRIIRGMGEYWLPTVPWLNVAMVRTGSVVGTRKNCVDLLHAEECVIAFPEGVRGINKPIWERYQLKEFGHGFMRLALETRTPIVPIAVVGSEEQAPGIANLRGLGTLLGMPAFPLTLTWPWLGPLGMIPFPVKYHIYFGEPMRFDGNPNDEDDVIADKVERVKERIAEMIAQGLQARRSLFW